MVATRFRAGCWSEADGEKAVFLAVLLFWSFVVDVAVDVIVGSFSFWTFLAVLARSRLMAVSYFSFNAAVLF